MKVLIVEDEAKMVSFLERGLKEENYEVDVATDGAQGWQLASQGKYDLFILDWMIPQISGVELCRKIREIGITAPVVLLTAKDSTDDKVVGLDAGADDYVTKPFSFDELLARIRALMRRPAKVQEETHLSNKNLRLDLLKRIAYVGQDKVILSQKEFKLLEFLLRHHGHPVSRTQIAERVWDLQFDPMSNTIDVYINFLRNKIDATRAGCKIETVRGVGYRLVDA